MGKVNNKEVYVYIPDQIEYLSCIERIFYCVVKIRIYNKERKSLKRQKHRLTSTYNTKFNLF